MSGFSHRFSAGVNPGRRHLLQVGFSGALGLGLANLRLAGAVAADGAASAGAGNFGRAKSVIFLFMTGAPSHQDIWDLKPDAPAEVRGEFRPVDTVVPGMLLGPHVPKLAMVADKFALVRSMTHSLPSHEHATHFVLTGVNQIPPGSTHMASRTDWPCYSATMQALRPREDGAPSGVMLPTYIHNGYGFSGQTGGFMGSQFDPWHVTKDPNAPDFNIEELTLLQGLNEQRLQNRRSLLSEMESQHQHLNIPAASQSLSRSVEKAHQLLGAAGKFRDVFDINREPAEVRDRYGRHSFGQSLLLARRLVEAGMPIIQANMGTMNNWDTHGDNFGQLKNRLLPPFDQGLAALLTDLAERGLLDTTLVVAVGEFGRTPQINAGAGRDHWSGVFTALFAGAGVQGGQVIGASDDQAAYPATRGWYPADLGATIFSALGIDPESTMTDRFARPHRVNSGQVIAPLYS